MEGDFWRLDVIWDVYIFAIIHNWRDMQMCLSIISNNTGCYQMQTINMWLCIDYEITKFADAKIIRLDIYPSNSLYFACFGILIFTSPPTRYNILRHLVWHIMGDNSSLVLFSNKGGNSNIIFF